MNEDIMMALGYEEEVYLMKQGICPSCHEKVDTREFKDALSWKEFRISGLCMACQDKFFGKEDE